MHLTALDKGEFRRWGGGPKLQNVSVALPSC